LDGQIVQLEKSHVAGIGRLDRMAGKRPRGCNLMIKSNDHKEATGQIFNGQI
jgi:hypothetical protein